MLFSVTCLMLMCAFSFPLSSQALTTPSEYTVLAPLPCIPTPARTDSSGNSIPEVPCPSGDLQNVTKVSFQTYVQYAINLLIAVAAVAAVFMIVWGGFEYMTTAVVSGKSDGIKKVTNAIYGLVLVLASYLIIRTIDPRFVDIPTTLVPQLKLVCPGQPSLLMSDPGCRSTSSTLLQQVQTLADQYKLSSQQLTATMQQTQNTITAKSAFSNVFCNNLT